MITLRAAYDDDMELLFHWRNDNESVSNSGSGRTVTWNEHRAWFTRRSGMFGLLVAEWKLTGEPVGMVRVDPYDYGTRGYSGEVSWIISPRWRGRNLGSDMLTQAVSKYFNKITLMAKIKTDNEASEKMAAKAGFIRASEDANGDLGTWIREPLSGQVASELPTLTTSI